MKSKKNIILGIAGEFSNENSYQPYIESIVFHNYKSLRDKEELIFNFPLTLLLGKNGTNKSSILHALYGCPEGKSTGEYWFSTHVDPISTENRPAYFYRYVVPGTSQRAEVLKAMIKNKNDPEYWEPSRPVSEYGMNSMPKLIAGQPIPEGRSKTRWNAIKKPVVYLDFRAEISAFDKAFYNGQNLTSRPQHRAKLRRWSLPLKDAIDKALKKRTYHKRERIFENHTFDKSSLDYVNSILGTDYTRIVYIDHDFYRSKSFSVYLKRDGRNDYSEAFAGSGETSIVRLVYALQHVEPKSLVLLDEPETSLHIEAQFRLREFVLEKIKEKKLQVIMSTHSPFFAKGLPDDAIKILSLDNETKQVTIINSAPANESSFYLGFKRDDIDKTTVYVEDSLAKALCEHVISNEFSDGERDVIRIEHYAGGETELLKLAAAESTKANSNVAFLFDGDCKPTQEIPDPDTIPASDNSKLNGILKELFGISNLKFPQDSGQPEQTHERIREFLRYARAHFRYLPCNTPEEFLVNESSDFPEESADAQNAKSILADKIAIDLGSSGDIDSAAILTCQRLILNKIPSNHNVFNEIAKSLRALKALRC